VITGQALRVFEARGNGRHGQRGRVAGQHGLCRHQRFEFGEQRFLDLQPLHDGFDDEVACRQVNEGGGQQQPFFVPGGRAGVDAAFFNQLVPLGADGFARFFGGARLRVHQPDGASGLHGDLRDAAPHGASANYSHIRVIYFHG
jgi:hypothetical protein